MAVLVFCIVFFAGYLLVDLSVIQPFHLLNVLHLPRIILWGSILVLFAWLFGDDTASKP